MLLTLLGCTLLVTAKHTSLLHNMPSFAICWSLLLNRRVFWLQYMLHFAILIHWCGFSHGGMHSPGSGNTTALPTGVGHHHHPHMYECEIKAHFYLILVILIFPPNFQTRMIQNCSENFMKQFHRSIPSIWTAYWFITQRKSSYPHEHDLGNVVGENLEQCAYCLNVPGCTPENSQLSFFRDCSFFFLSGSGGGGWGMKEIWLEKGGQKERILSLKGGGGGVVTKKFVQILQWRHLW